MSILKAFINLSGNEKGLTDTQRMWAMNNAGYDLFSARNYSTAKIVFDEAKAALRIYANSGNNVIKDVGPLLYNTSGWTNAVLGNVEEAKDDFQTAVQLDPGRSKPRLGLSLLEQHDRVIFGEMTDGLDILRSGQ